MTGVGRFWTPERRAAAIAQIQIGVAMAKSRGVEAGSISNVQFHEAQMTKRKSRGKGRKC